MVQRRTVVSALAALPIASFAASHLAWAQHAGHAADTIPTADGDISVHPIEHASLVLTHGDHFDVPTLEAIAGSAPIIANQDVFDKLPESLKGQAEALANGGTTEHAGLPVEATTAHNITEDRMQYHPVGVGNGYLITFADKIVYVAGDTEPTPEMLKLSGIEAAFLPMNLPYTMTPEQAAEAINTFKPRIVYPYHYGESDLSVLDSAVEEGVEVRLLEWYPNGRG